IQILSSQKRIFLGLLKVSFNGIKVIDANNMYCEWRADVGPYLRKEANTIRIHFRSPIGEHADRPKGPPYHKTAENEASKPKVSSYTRKAPHHFGWDWGPRMVSFGIWRPVYLMEWESAKLKDIQIYQDELTEDLAKLHADISWDQVSSQDLRIVIKDEQSGQLLAEGNATANSTLNWTINNPKRWWTHNLGDPYLYHWVFELYEGDQLLDQKIKRFGLRTIELIHKPDTLGTSFYFKLNGVPVFMKGANYIPSDALLPRRTKADIDRVLNDAQSVNMNMIRIWGGGIYEDNYFYDQCDERGILIWQDFMFACAMYPADEPFLSNIKNEITQNVKRLRNHPCIAIWCGNNEIEVAWNNWGWQLRYLISKKDSTKMWEDYQTIFHKTIPEVLKKYDATRPYTSTSPISNWGKLKNFDHATMHFWGVWHGRQPFTDYKVYIGRFVSEYGFQSFPDWKTIEAFAPESEHSLLSTVMKAHQKSYIGNGMIDRYAKNYFKKPSNFKDFVYKSQLTQMIGIRTAIRSHRADMPRCMGTLYWQLDDCWPGPSWSSVDYFGRWKALHYALKELYADVLIVPNQIYNDLMIDLVSDHLEDQELTMSISAKTLDGKVINESTQQIILKGNSAEEFTRFKWKDFTKKKNRKAVYVDIQLKKGNQIIAQTLHHFVPAKDMKLVKPKLEIQLDDSGQTVKVKSNTFVKGFYLMVEDLDVQFESNYLDLQAGQWYEFKTSKQLTTDQLNYQMCNP
ncbi:MAG: glycoside hydrolase family 2 protein, partial [Bacteroidota bacterium]